MSFTKSNGEEEATKQMEPSCLQLTPKSNKTFRAISTFAASILVFGLLAWDLIAMKYAPYDTISSVLSEWNPRTGGLLALIFLALFIHWFLPLPDCWVGCRKMSLG